MDFFNVKTIEKTNGIYISPEFLVKKSNDLMVRGKNFYAIWDEDKNLWSTDEYDVVNKVDSELYKAANELKNALNKPVYVLSMNDFSSNSWTMFKNYLNRISDNSHELDSRVVFANENTTKEDYISKKLPYSLDNCETPNYEKLISTLYDPEEREKIEWAVGSIISGDSKKIQKFLVFYGEPGSGKSTIINIIQKIFEGYYTTFDSKALAGNNNAFATEVFRGNPLLAVQHDGDLSKIEDNAKLNSIISHEEMTLNEKYKPSYTSRINCLLMMATNKPVKITDAKSGIIRRLIDVKPSGRKLSPREYDIVKDHCLFELGGIAKHCLDVYLKLGPDYYNSYRSLDMVMKTDVFYNFVEDNYEFFSKEKFVTLKHAYDLYKDYCDNTLVEFKLPMYKFREELKNYFDTFSPTYKSEDRQFRSVYSDFIKSKFAEESEKEEELKVESEKSYGWLAFNYTESLLDTEISDQKAQYTNRNENPCMKWSEVKTTLNDIDTRKLHFTFVPENMIVIDFDLKDKSGEKSFEANLQAASKWPSTYAELSKSGKGIHLHYYYTGDLSRLSMIYDNNIEIKVFKGNASLRRKLTLCNDVPIATISSGLPLKGEDSVVNYKAIQDENHLRCLIKKNLNKECCPGTKPSIDFIDKLMTDAYNSGINYDVTDLRPAITAFANNSSHQADYCLKKVCHMKFKSEEPSIDTGFHGKDDDSDIYFFDVEVKPNLLLIVYKLIGEGNKCVRMFNPSPTEVEKLFDKKLVGFNNRDYDNHILYGRYIGYNNEQIYNLSYKLINKSENAKFSEAYKISYTDVFDFASAGNKKSLKKFEIELGIKHQEFPHPWDEPLPEERWDEIAEYCENDVIATEKVFYYLESDWAARKILAKLSGLTPNDTTNQHSTKIIFGDDPNPQKEFIYTDLSKDFPGYKFENGESFYKGIKPGEGGCVIAEPGMYIDVALLDVASMHPSSIEALNLFGPKYTEIFSSIKKARILIKHGQLDEARKIFNGALAPFLDDPKVVKNLPNALKTVINSVYGLTAAHFPNKFRDPRNIDNIVAKRGALFMIDLREAVIKRGFKVAHIKTDSIKIPNATPEIIEFVMDFGRKYGYEFEHECTYERICLVNDAVYIAKFATEKDCIEKYGYSPKENIDDGGKWTATGTQFAVPYVFKTLFSKEKINFEDLCETKSVKSALYLDFNEGLEDVSDYENELEIIKKAEKGKNVKRKMPDLTRGEVENRIAKGHNYSFIGKVGLFCPVVDGVGGGVLVRDGGGKYDAVTGTKGFRWLESVVVENLSLQDKIDYRYFANLVDDAKDNIATYGDADAFIFGKKDECIPPWM